ncbi:hypothetical protein N7448_009959 [Penicillium atrosanguineum]|uniref:Endoplasmic reticulum junction formation protein lunapark n=1 Tax=Penicillium atrosanguineum TaxID=1132637 RepID=A0A9W9GFJ3_9EURO|nr:uncharacterized protein N7443_007174 [Penicillium atrosanguineum]KAJ5118244.1 hypothetical protein N7526_009881 [Penicillium atrosanguineum]KAJ5119290.1 hypothetical protein N7448_009959 [Penicillium atrosanguineum]KAJ5296281.1 hypothetical protein N7443_007174 [Penicillium atrosanguineum]KAJ5299052.1 hypothetical protein N7476_010609 [Penicillium atrosanguineum]
MVSFWPWKGQDDSPASFEKTLSTLSTKIAQATTRLDQQRQTSRRFKALWTLYSTFAYLFYSIVLALVLGWETWGVKEYAAIAGGPVLIYAVRTIGSRLFEYRISRTQRGVDELQKQRDKTIEKLKTATKYNSTQQLLEKYGGGSPTQSPAPKGNSEKPKPVTPKQPHVARTGLPPPPTANIRRPSSQQPRLPQQPQTGEETYQNPNQKQPYPNAPPSPQYQQPQPQPQDQPDFAPNAFPGQQGPYIEQPHWYDRLLDVLLGEDEMQPRNRMAMICTSCRLVNGQAPPGIKTPEELGRWRCGSCGNWNGVESETTKILSTLRETVAPEGTLDQTSTEVPTQEEFADDDDEVIVSREDQNTPSQDSDDLEETQNTPEEDSKAEPVRRSKRKGAKK